ncbi:polysaccharide export protein [candidate division KSB1 bacterium]|nr:polysaccharide export protein [candidate division KSB1 bacterium]
MIKPGDAIQIIVYEHEELSQTVTVSADGTVGFPSLEGLPVDGITLQRFREIIVAQLSRYIERSPLVTVRFAETYPTRVTILGQVANPGVHVVLNTSTIQGAVIAAGGFSAGAQLSQIKLIRSEGENKTSHTVNMERFYLSGDPSTLPELKDGDTIVVPGNPIARTVKVLGSVERPGSFEVSFQTSLLDILFMAGGPTEDANLKKIKIASFANPDAQEVNINIKKIWKTKNLKSVPIVFPGDVVYVPSKKVTWGKFIDLMRDVSALVMVYYFIQLSNR